MSGKEEKGMFGRALESVINSAVGSSDKTKKIVENKKATEDAAKRAKDTGKKADVVVVDTNDTNTSPVATNFDVKTGDNSKVGKKATTFGKSGIKKKNLTGAALMAEIKREREAKDNKSEK